MLWQPKVDVPIVEVLHCWDFLTKESEGRVDGVKYFWRRRGAAEDEISRGRAEAQSVNRKGCGEPDQPVSAAAGARFCLLRGGGLGLVCGGLGHRQEALQAPELAVPVVERVNSRHFFIQEYERGIYEHEGRSASRRCASKDFEDRAWTECVDNDEHGNQPKDAAAGLVFGIRGDGRVVGHVQRISGLIGIVKGRND